MQAKWLSLRLRHSSTEDGPIQHSSSIIPLDPRDVSLSGAESISEESSCMR